MENNKRKNCKCCDCNNKQHIWAELDADPYIPRAWCCTNCGTIVLSNVVKKETNGK